MSDIPTKARQIVQERSGGRCERCGGVGEHLHHRRRRRPAAGHDQHCPCILVRLCSVCHAAAHLSNQTLMQVSGFQVSAYEDEPWTIPLQHSLYGWVTQNCDGTYVLCGQCENCSNIRPLENGLCWECLTNEVCCRSYSEAAVAMCGCGGSAAEALERLAARTGEREPA